ncbi:MAG: glycosyltransferase family 39 protein [Planctomycetes bacterium]|nr:glycosyltransferase family 39 protein [Planctomycetota bacterium]
MDELTAATGKNPTDAGPPLWDRREVLHPPPLNGLLAFWTLLIAAAYFLLLVIWLDTTPSRDAVLAISRIGPAMLEVNLGIVLAAAALNLGGLWALVRSLTRGARLGLALVAAGGFLSAALLAPRVHRIYYDEDIYGIIGLSMATNGRAIMPTEAEWRLGRFVIHSTPVHPQASFQETHLGHYNKQPNALPFLFSLIYRVFGPNERLSHLANSAAVGAAVFFVFLTAWMLFRRESLALYAAIIYAAIPDNLRWGNTMAVEPMASAFLAGTVFCTLFACVQPSASRLVLLASLAAFTVQFRPEALMIGLVVLLVFVLYRPKEFLGNRLYLAGLLFLALLPHHWCHIHLVRGHSWGAEGEKFAPHFLWTDGRRGEPGPTPDPMPIGLAEALSTGEWRDGNLAKNTRFFFRDPLDRFPPLYAWLFVLGVVGGGSFLLFADWNLQRFLQTAVAFLYRNAPWKEKSVPLLWFGLFWGIFLFFYAGSYYYGADDRFSLLCYAPAALMAGVGAETLERLLGLFMPARASRTLVVFGLLIVFSRYIGVVRDVGEEAWLARADHDWAVEMARKLPPDSVVLSNNPSIFNLCHLSAGQIRLAKDFPERVDDYLRRYPDKVFLHWGFWQEVDPGHREYGETGLVLFGGREATEVERRPVRQGTYTYSFRFHRLSPRQVASEGGASEGAGGDSSLPRRPTTSPTSLPREAVTEGPEGRRSYLGPPLPDRPE